MPTLLVGLVTVSVLFEFFSGPWGPSPSAILNRASTRCFHTNIEQTLKERSLETWTYPPTHNPLFTTMDEIKN